MLKACRFLVVALGPILALRLYDHFGDHLNQPIKDYADLFSVVWIAVCIASEVDPRWSERLGGIKEVVNVLRPTAEKPSKD